MKKNILFIAWVALFSLFASNSQAQSLKDLLNKDNISKVVNAITGTPETIDMTGTWTYSGSAVEFESDNLLMKAGGAAAATMAENKLTDGMKQSICRTIIGPMPWKLETEINPLFVPSMLIMLMTDTM